MPGADTTALRRERRRHGVAIVPGSLFYADGSGGENVRLSFSMVDESLIDEGIERLVALVSTRWLIGNSRGRGEGLHQAVWLTGGRNAPRAG